MASTPDPGTAPRGRYATPAEASITRQKALDNDGTMVTVVCITYGHEEYIAQALESFIAQQTDFTFKIFVGEDCGPDGTADIVRAYAEKYPGLVIPFVRESNMGATRNLVDLCQRATSPYIAFCEGDDYWVDVHKLQKQFDYMEAHPKLKVCSTRTEIATIPGSHLNSWLKATSDGKLYYPDSLPGYHGQKIFRPSELVQQGFCHTSSLFYRWNYDLQIPDWYYGRLQGDWPLILMQTGRTRVGFIPEVTSVYRVNESSVFYSNDRTSLFLATRLDWVTGLLGFLDFAEQNFKDYSLTPTRNKIRTEVTNYLAAAIQVDDMERVAQFFAEYPEAARIALPSYIASYRDQRALVGELTWDGYLKVMRNAANRKLVARIMRPTLYLQQQGDRVWRKLRNAGRMISYWTSALVPKRSNRWVFTSFRNRGYLDNSRHLFEYVSAHHPDIEATWITRDEATLQEVQQQGWRAVMVGTPEARRALSHAKLAFTDHFRQSDYAPLAGHNHGTKVVQLWHGVGLKRMGDLRNTNVAGVRRSRDILPCATDGPVVKLRKGLRYLRYARSRELMEEYFGFVSPGPQTDRTALSWKVPQTRWITAGYPRNSALYEAAPNTDEPRILYAPTYRWDSRAELDLVKRLCAAIPEIDERMDALGARFAIRLHPHTWRSYQALLGPAMRGSSRIDLDDSADIAETLGGYSVLVTDYSSIVFDFLLLDRPCVFFCYDLAEFQKREVALLYDYSEYSPGTQAVTWASTLDAVAEYLREPTKDHEWRQRVLPEFWNPTTSGPDSSERIVAVLKERLGL